MFCTEKERKTRLQRFLGEPRLNPHPLPPKGAVHLQATQAIAWPFLVLTETPRPAQT
jgi:hypothetical protein